MNKIKTYQYNTIGNNNHRIDQTTMRFFFIEKKTKLIIIKKIAAIPD